MERTYSRDTGKTTWSFTSWYEKTVLIFGWIITVYLLLAFVVGFITGLVKLVV